MDGKSIEKLAEIKSSVLANEAAKFIILNFKDTSMISGEAVTLLAQLQMNIRAKKLHLRLCGLKNDLIQKLLMLGVIRNSEVTADLQSALQNLIEHRK